MDQKFETIRDCFSMENRILRHHGCYCHPRTQELIIGIEADEVKHVSFVSRKYRSLVTPATEYHRQLNRPCSVKRGTGEVFAVSPNGECRILPKVQLGTERRGKPTRQWKSIWYSRDSRRA